ncbi:protein-export chaperone SecB [Levilactobacillus parabrevis]|uniref:protein-export chaperone SecB n=1 Tax=Levilactobacillus parabrevis TaxID=357278 RepID=UPI00035D0D1B|nr:protein-export chaperone SecB [Levilactobacillus parabrevis]
MAVLEFANYRVKNMSYQRNEKYKINDEKIIMNPQVSRKINVDKNRIYVTLSVVVGSIEDEKLPFQVTCSVIGTFDYRPKEDESEIDLDQLVRVNAVAILYPYVRSIITMLTATSNEYPSYIMPTINVSKVLASQEE